jgi:3-dehydro-L-gulonate 2-dehydrogenase
VVGATSAAATADAIIAHHVHRVGDSSGAPVRYPGERTLQLRAEHMQGGVPVDPEVWQRILQLVPGAGV